MSLIVNQVVLAEVGKALDVLDMSHDKLPEVKDKDGVVVTDVKDKRLALLRKYLLNVGQIVDIMDQAEGVSEQLISQALQAYHGTAVRDVIQRMTGGRLKGLPGMVPPPNGSDPLAAMFDEDSDATYPDGQPRRMGFPVPNSK